MSSTRPYKKLKQTGGVPTLHGLMVDGHVNYSSVFLFAVVEGRTRKSKRERKAILIQSQFFTVEWPFRRFSVGAFIVIIYCSYTGVVLALGLWARARAQAMVSMVCCGVVLWQGTHLFVLLLWRCCHMLLVSQVRKGGLMLCIRVGYAPAGGFGARTAPLLRRRRTLSSQGGRRSLSHRPAGHSSFSWGGKIGYCSIDGACVSLDMCANAGVSFTSSDFKLRIYVCILGARPPTHLGYYFPERKANS